VIYLDIEDLLHIAERTIGNVEVRDLGLLESAAARPQASAFGEDAYPLGLEKATALIHSIARNRALVDGNKAARTRWGDRVPGRQRSAADDVQRRGL
jgi:death on curing protein